MEHPEGQDRRNLDGHDYIGFRLDYVLASEDAFHFCMAFEQVFLAILFWSWNHEHAGQHVVKFKKKSLWISSGSFWGMYAL